MFCKRTQPSIWQCLFKSAVAIFAVVGFFGTLACLKRKGKKMKKAVTKIGGECIDACESLCDEMCDCMTDKDEAASKNGKASNEKE